MKNIGITEIKIKRDSTKVWKLVLFKNDNYVNNENQRYRPTLNNEINDKNLIYLIALNL